MIYQVVPRKKNREMYMRVKYKRIKENEELYGKVATLTFLLFISQLFLKAISQFWFITTLLKNEQNPCSG